MFLNDIRKGVSDFMIWKSIRPKGVLTVAVFSNFMGVLLPNLILVFPAYEISICG